MAMFGLQDNSSKVLVLANLTSILLAVIFSYSFISIMWAYWFESIILGFFAVLSLLSKAYFSKEKNTIPTGLVIFMVVFFIIHYGIFHFVYAGFLTFFGIMFSNNGIRSFFSGASSDGFNFNFGANSYEIVPIVVLLFLSHAYSFYKNMIVNREIEKENNFFSNMGLIVKPYARIIPMHLTIIISGFVFVLFYFFVNNAILNIILIAIFMSVKTITDLGAHEIKHNLKAKFFGLSQNKDHL
ncbi:MAG TPA: DUF6498-containing protein [Candidatus Bilamarchaeaceae archaeon]|nr:DUF6498-containing protein [Candidatus Bilamarchaeaceae archaeon]